ncbi:hypothetical protein BJ508DRAFT_334665 [Ascobolus immersus RN42]|uniref:Uncharacterized protein n=1 Tax=Ascobolus immersus RN42 TaxID=1160509 RepID=A0A3N4HF83_ASCIM|nr:hypothetical protein BJ508DRAFT_334665 [Ascobolus immersus RN42]
MQPRHTIQALSVALILLSYSVLTVSISIPEPVPAVNGPAIYQLVSNTPTDNNACRKAFDLNEYEFDSVYTDTTSEEQIRKTLDILRKSCKLEPVKESLAALAAQPDGRGFYRDFNTKSWPDYTERYDASWSSRPTRLRKWEYPIYVEVICNTSGGSPPTKDVEAMGTKVTARGKCKPFDLYKACSINIEIGEAKSSNCPASKILEETPDNGKFKSFESDGNDTLFTTAAKRLSPIYGADNCWFRENVLPELIAMKCENAGRVGGIVRLGVLVDKTRYADEDEHRDKSPSWKLVWVMDVTVHR